MSAIALLCWFAPLAAAPEVSPPRPDAGLFQDDLKQQYEEKRAAAEGDVKALWTLHAWCESNSLEKEGRSCLRAILELDKDDAKAHELLGHILYDGKWFTSESKLAAYKKQEEEKMAKEQGLVRYGDGWAHPDDIPFLEKGLVKTADGKWVDPIAQKRIEEGWKQQDLNWIPPAEFPKLEQGLWKCGDQWLSEADADAFHAELGQWWIIPGTYYHLYTTLPRKVAMEALSQADRTFTQLQRIYGVTPAIPLRVGVLRSFEQYNIFAGGNEKWPGTDAAGLQAAYGAFLAEGWMDPTTREWLGCGTGYWDFSTDAGNSFGRLFTRHAAGLSYADAIDPSPKAIQKAKASPQGRVDGEEFHGEKKIPGWFRYGAAAYVERYFVDQFVAQGEDPLQLRKWSIQNIASRGGLDDLGRIFELKIGPDAPDSDKLINQTGLLVCFVVDGGCEPVSEKHEAVKAALKSGEGVEKAFTALQKEIEKNSDKLRVFANL